MGDSHGNTRRQKVVFHLHEGDKEIWRSDQESRRAPFRDAKATHAMLSDAHRVVGKINVMMSKFGMQGLSPAARDDFRRLLLSVEPDVDRIGVDNGRLGKRRRPE